MTIIPQLVYLLCAATSLMCTTLLARRYKQTRLSLLFWSSLAFLAFAISNILLFIDLVIVGPAVDLSFWRTIPTLVGVVLMLYGLIRAGTDL